MKKVYTTINQLVQQFVVQNFNRERQVLYGQIILKQVFSRVWTGLAQDGVQLHVLVSTVKL
jgi:hypothetical protein